MSFDSSFPSLVDIGVNLSHRRFREDLEQVIARASAARVGTIVVTGTSVAASRAALALCQEQKQEVREVALFSTAGIHPHEARTFDRGARETLRAMLANDRVVAVGECGLDYDRMFSTEAEQLRAFEAQLDLAVEAKKPVFLHEREAHPAFCEVMKRRRAELVGGVVHCFTGDERALMAYLSLDLHVGMTGFLCDERRGRHLVPLVAKVPAGRLMIETDAPFLLPRTMSPRPRDGRNEPAFLPHVLRAVAEARRESPEETARHTSETANAFFGLS